MEASNGQVEVVGAEHGDTAIDAIERWRQPAEVRTRTVRWSDPRGSGAHALERSGLDWLRTLAAAELPTPPIGLLLGFAPTEIEDGRVVFEMIPGEHLYNPIGTVHGGVAATLLDSAMSSAVHTTLPAGHAYTTTDLQVRYVRPITADTPRVRAEGNVVHRGRRVATAEGRLVDVEGRLYAHGTTSCLIFELP